MGRSVIMNIQNNCSYNNYNVSMQGKGRPPKLPGDDALGRLRKKIEQKIIDLLPEKTFKDGEKRLDCYDKCGSIIARPDANRLIMGVTALATQPAIDYYNHRVDEETRTVSRNRTLAKIIACMSVGIMVRGTCFQMVNKMTNLSGVKKLSKALIPKEFINTFKTYPDKLANYKNALSTIMALGIMTITNFVLDAPLTVFFTNRFNERTARKARKKEVGNG